jgi:hypothetical protein
MIKTIIKQLAILGGLAFAWHLLFFLIAITIFPVPPYDAFDAKNASSTVFDTDFRYIAYCAPLYDDTRGKRIFFFGSSNPLLGFRPEEVKAFLPSYSIHNFCARECNISQTHSIVNYVLTGLDTKDLTCVIGIWYGAFSDYSKRYHGKKNHFDTERSRYRLLGTDLFPYSPSRNRLRLASFAIYPYVCISHCATKLSKLFMEYTRSMRIKFHAKLKVSGPEPDQPAPTKPCASEGDIRNWVDNILQISFIDEEQFRELYALCSSLKAKGVTVIVVDLPLPQRHTAIIPLFQIYQNIKTTYIHRLENIGVFYSNIQHLSKNEDFYDIAHPSPEATSKWAQAFCERLTGIPGCAVVQPVEKVRIGK